MPPIIYENTKYVKKTTISEIPLGYLLRKKQKIKSIGKDVEKLECL